MSARQEAFVTMMTKSPDHADRGFSLLSEREDALDFFAPLQEAGLLDAAKNPGPVSVADKEGFVRIPYWRALDYLQGLARHSNQKHDLKLAHSLLQIVTALSSPVAPAETVVDNYHTFRKLAEIVGLLPIEAIEDSTIELVPIWLTSKYDRSLSAIAVSDGLLSNLLADASDEAVRRACRILTYLTHFEHRSEDEVFEITTVVDDFWLKEILSKHSKSFGTSGRGTAAAVVESRLREVFAARKRPYRSSIWRPAIEDHEQNRGHRRAENIFVEGLRDILIAWAESGDNSIELYLGELLQERDVEVLQRIALHVIDEHYDRFQDLFPPSTAVRFLDNPYRHELYRFLDRHFSDFSEEGKSVVVQSIRSIHVEDKHNEARRRAYVQRDWCSAIRGKGYQPADDLFKMLDTDRGLGELSDHPDFLSFFTMRAGPDRSPFTAEILAEGAKEGRLAELTASFNATGGSWREPTEEGLWDALKDVVWAQPELFVDKLDEYVGVQIPLIYAIISGLSRRLQEPAGKTSDVPVNRIWRELIAYFERVVSGPEFWIAEDIEGQTLLPTRNWVLSAIADTLAAGTRSDDKAYPKELLPAGWRIIQVLLDKCPQIDELELADLSMQAINTSRGRAIEAAVNHALRASRLARKKSVQDQTVVWNELAPVFDTQLAKTNGSNYEFSVLMAQYLANLDYLSPAWLDANFGKIFSRSNSDNFRCALAGLAYATLTGRIYKLLVQHEVIVTALDTTPQKRQERERVIEFMCLALLWGDENLDSPQFRMLFEQDREADLITATDWFWSVHDDEMSEKRKRVVRRFWAKVLTWSDHRKTVPIILFSKLCRLAWYVETLDKSSTELLRTVAPYAGQDFNVSELTEALLRLTPSNPQSAALITEAMLSRQKPHHDFGGQLKALLLQLFEHGQREVVFRAVDKLTASDPSMVQFYRELSAR